ncbi:enoyl-CoA hydratase/isomerase family protein [Coccidioides immitis H538.4]|uniref:Enoyl-CoA hydratase/isomerase family protein n=1 Tax=Coccidioides immitis H538.4 TaxID=396776 RepID=A0A0J8REF5_COCIT|nr:enoyl-CoA hydratase/isomerase family protein [Coccidioides immitis H538.4]
MASVTLPTSYAALPTQHIKLSHVPATSPTPTPILLMTLNRPDKLNAFTPTMCNEMVSIFNTVDVDDRVKVVVVTGSGTKAFCAGADLELGFPKGKGKDGHTNRGDVTRPKDHRDGGGRVTLAIHNCRKPTIMALNGSAVGIGITMTLPATIRLATANTKIGFVFARRGLVMEAATLDRALEIAEDIAQNTSTVSTSLMRDMMYRGPDSPEGAHLLDSAIIYSLFGGKDNEEGIRSFFEKRKPQFKASVTNPDDMPSFYPWWNPIDLTPRLEKAKL